MNEDSGSTPFLGGEHKGRRSFIFIRSPYLLFLDALLVTAVIWLLIVQHKTRQTQLDCQGDVTGYVPNFTNRLVVFEEQHQFVSNHSSKAS